MKLSGHNKFSQERIDEIRRAATQYPTVREMAKACRTTRRSIIVYAGDLVQHTRKRGIPTYKQIAIKAAVRAGMTQEQAAAKHGVPVHSVRRLTQREMRAHRLELARERLAYYNEHGSRAAAAHYGYASSSVVRKRATHWRRLIEYYDAQQARRSNVRGTDPHCQPPDRFPRECG